MDDTLRRFAVAYGATGHELPANSLQLVDDSGTGFAPDAVLPCGLPAGSDAFVRSSTKPTALPEESRAAAAAAAAAAVAAAGAPSAAATQATAALAAPAPGVYAKAGSAIAASQAKMGENSYYYSVGKNRGAPSGKVTAAVPTVSAMQPAPVPVAVAERPARLVEQTLSTYSSSDEDAVMKVHVPLPGAGVLPAGAITCEFRPRAFDLKVMSPEGKLLRLHVSAHSARTARPLAHAHARARGPPTSARVRTRVALRAYTPLSRACLPPARASSARRRPRLSRCG